MITNNIHAYYSSLEIAIYVFVIILKLSQNYPKIIPETTPKLFQNYLQTTPKLPHYYCYY